MVKRIELTRGKYALVDDEDFEELNQYSWHILPRKEGGYYAKRGIRKEDGSQTTEYMHRHIMDAPDNMQVDHINHDTLDNRKGNLRLCTSAENHHNQLPRGGTSQYKGVDWYKSSEKWRAQIKVDGKRHHLGYFDDESDAARAYNEAAREYFGEFAYLNDVQP